MPFARKVAISVNLNEPHPEILNAVRSLEFLNLSEVYLMTVQLTTTYAIGLGESSIIYPLESEQRKIKEQSIAKLKEIGRLILPSGFKGKFGVECIFSDDPKRKFCEFVEDNHIDTVILAAREKRGIFESSFTNFVAKHSKANIIILKHAV